MYDIRDPYEDEEERRRTLEALLSGTNGPNEPAPAPEPEVRAQMQAEDFPDMPRQRREMTPPPQTGDMPSERQESGGMDWQVLAALVLDAGMNRGRGMGQLLGAYGNNQDENRRERRALARSKKDNAFNEWATTERLAGDVEDRELRRKQLEDVQGRAVHKFGEAESIDSNTSQTKIGLAGATADKRVRATQAAKHELNPEIVEDTENIAEGRATGATKGATDEARRNPKELTKAQVADDERANAQFEESKRGRAATEAATRATLELKQKTERQAEYNKFRDSNKSLLDAAVKAELLQRSIDKSKGGDVPGLGMWDSNKFGGISSADDIANRQLYAAVTNPEIKRLFGTAVSKNEAGRGNKEFATNMFATESEQLQAFKLMRDSIRQQILFNSKGREDIAREVLAAGDLDLSDILPAAEAAALPQPGGGNPLANTQELPGKIKPLKSTATLGEGPDEDELKKRYGGYGVRF